MGLTVLDRIEFVPDTLSVMAHLGLDPDLYGEIAPLVREAEELAVPRACYVLAPVESLDDDRVRLGGTVFFSHVLSVNLAGSREAGLFVATCGQELERWAESFQDMLQRWCAEEICQLALRAAGERVDSELDSLLPGPHYATMNPGSFPDWPLEQQADLFGVLEGVTPALGVELTPSFLMRPRKSRSGVRFASEIRYSNCRLCSRENCPGRRMPYDEMEYGRRYGRASSLSPSCVESIPEEER